MKLCHKAKPKPDLRTQASLVVALTLPHCQEFIPEGASASEYTYLVSESSKIKFVDVKGKTHQWLSSNNERRTIQNYILGCGKRLTEAATKKREEEEEKTRSVAKFQAEIARMFQ